MQSHEYPRIRSGSVEARLRILFNLFPFLSGKKKRSYKQRKKKITSFLCILELVSFLLGQKKTKKNPPYFLYHITLYGRVDSGCYCPLRCSDDDLK